MDSDGGYDEGYRDCPCFWGSEPGSLVKMLPKFFPHEMASSFVWDAGCGEGKNAIHFARSGARVLATDVSSIALDNAKKFWPDASLVDWRKIDVLDVDPEPETFNIVVMYGLLHCLENPSEIKRFVEIAKTSCKADGLHILVAFNERKQELHAHPGFAPTLVADSFYRELYTDWELVHHSDTDLHETHPHNNIPHMHSMTRLIARKTRS